VPHFRRFFAAVALAAGGTGLLCAPPGSAQLVPPTPCSVSAVSQAFLQWGDTHFYEQVTGGDFESSLSGWSLAGGATVAPTSDRFGAAGVVGSSSLEVPQGAVVLTPPTCVNVPHPVTRLFARGASGGAQLRVEAVYENGQRVVRIPAGPPQKPSADWQPVQPLKIHPVVSPALHGAGTTLMTLELTATNGTVYVDDVFVDPRGRW
jgi:hypothetical protein